MNEINESVGKRIVDALKQQSDIEIQNVVENPAEPDEISYESNSDYNYENSEFDYNNSNVQQTDLSNNPGTMTFTQAPAFNDTFSADIDSFEIPTNVAVLKQLITQLPAGVSKQTGAQIIKQTMEALGITMKSVLQEAQQVQESINMASKDCQASIMEHRKQISLLERQAQKLQRQYSSLNDIISLFIQTNL